MITGLQMNPAMLIAAGLAVMRVAEADGYTYLGYSLEDAPAEDAALWLICRRDTAGSMAFADGTRDFTKRWDLRATYTYAI